MRRFLELTAIFAFAFATLLFEVTTTKIFEFSLWANYAYLAVSTAMFGLGLSGVVLTRWPGISRVPLADFLPAMAFAGALAMLGAFAAVNGIPIHLSELPEGWTWGRELRNVTAVFLALASPFLCFGLAISRIFDERAEVANVYYFADLIGAGLGALAVALWIPTLEPEGLAAAAAAISAGAGALFLAGGADRPGPVRLATAGVLLALAVAGGVIGAPRMRDRVELRVNVGRADYLKDWKARRFIASGWSSLSRVDIVPMSAERLRVHIAGGSNVSSIRRFNGDYDALRAQRPKVLADSAKHVQHLALPHLAKTNHTVCMIGTSGGEDSLTALSLGARHVTGIEMDPTIARFVTETFTKFAGGLFNDPRHATMIVDEGRSFLRRSPERFDVIQQVNNFTPIAFQNGAMNLSETYLLTVESFREFHDHLTDDGILAITRYGAIRLLSNAVEMFRRMGLKPEEYGRHLFVGEGGRPVEYTFMMKRSPFTPAEVDGLFAFYAASGARKVLYAPYRTNDLPARAENLYLQIATAADPAPLYRMGCFDFRPTTDDRPFFNRMKVLGVQDRHRERLPLLPAEIREVERPGRIDKRVPQGDLPPLIVLAEGLLLAGVFFGLPLATRRDLRDALRGARRVLGYFACLGLGFIFVEICLIQRLVLFLGSPVYSIAAVLGSLLIFAGLGALVSGRLAPTQAVLARLLPAAGAAILLLHVALPPLTHAFLGHSLPVRFAVAFAITGLAGFVLGMPMPLGIRHLKARGLPVIPWAWATNGYFTVIGTALTVLLAAGAGFSVVFVTAALIYAVAPWFLRRAG